MTDGTWGWWRVSLGLPADIRWDDSTWVVPARSAEEAVRTVAASEDFLDWFDSDEPPAVGWAIPMLDPANCGGAPSHVMPDRKYEAAEFEAMWNDDAEVEVVL